MTILLGGDCAILQVDNLKGVDTAPGQDRDEWPMACCREGSVEGGGSVKLIDSSQNRGFGATAGNQLRDVADHETFMIDWD